MGKQARTLIIIAALLLCGAGLCGGGPALAADPAPPAGQAVGVALPQFKIDATSVVLIDALSGQTLFEQNAGERMAPASLVKLMTLYIAYDTIKMGLIKLDDAVLISKKAWATQGSKMFVQVGTRVELLTLLQGIASVSGNDACIAVAEHIAGMEEAFVPKMNEKARRLGLNNTNFVNVSGLPAITLPVGQSPDGLPVGVQLVGRPGGEHVLLALGAQRVGLFLGAQPGGDARD